MAQLRFCLRKRHLHRIIEVSHQQKMCCIDLMKLQVASLGSLRTRWVILKNVSTILFDRFVWFLTSFSIFLFPLSVTGCCLAFGTPGFPGRDQGSDDGESAMIALAADSDVWISVPGNVVRSTFFWKWEGPEKDTKKAWGILKSVILSWFSILTEPLLAFHRSPKPSTLW